MRGCIDGLPSPHRLGAMLPSLYQEDEFAQRLTGALDAVIAPAMSTLDNRHAYFDPTIAPADFVSWLAGWVGVSLDENWPLDRRRALVANAADLYRGRGTVPGLAAHLALYTGVEPEIEESGGAVWSATPGAALPGRASPELRVRVRQHRGVSLDKRRIEAIVRDARPAHVPYRVEISKS